MPTCPSVAAALEQRHTDPHQEAEMSTPRSPRPTARTLERLVARRRAARSRDLVRSVLAGDHGAGVRADVVAAMKRR